MIFNGYVREQIVSFVFLRPVLVVFVCITCPLWIACSQDTMGMRDGYYTAEADVYTTDGWKSYVTIYVSAGKIVTAEYNAKNSSGFIRSWDVDHMRADKKCHGIDYNQVTRYYTYELVNKQLPAAVRQMPEDTRMYGSFRPLAEAAISQAATGNRVTVKVPLP